MKFVLYRSARGKRDWRFRLVARNNEPIAASEGYRRRVDAVKAIDLIKGRAAAAIIVERK